MRFHRHDTILVSIVVFITALVLRYVHEQRARWTNLCNEIIHLWGCHGTGKTGNSNVLFSESIGNVSIDIENTFLYREFTSNTRTILKLRIMWSTTVVIGCDLFTIEANFELRDIPVMEWGYCTRLHSTCLEWIISSISMCDDRWINAISMMNKLRTQGIWFWSECGSPKLYSRYTQKLASRCQYTGAE